MAGLVLTGGREDPGLTGSPTPAATLVGAQIAMKQKRMISLSSGLAFFFIRGTLSLRLVGFILKRGLTELPGDCSNFSFPELL